MLACLAAVTGAATGFFNPASTGLMPQLVPPEQLQPANALRSSVVSLGEILGPLIAGLIVAGAVWVSKARRSELVVETEPPSEPAREVEKVS